MELTAKQLKETLEELLHDAEFEEMEAHLENPEQWPEHLNDGDPLITVTISEARLLLKILNQHLEEWRIEP